jgi:Glycosyl hydrolase family 1
VTTRARLLVTLEGYAVEGGFDRSGEPMTCYSPTISLGRHAGPGGADDLWRDYEKVLDLVPSLGFDGVRLSLEWARVEPRPGEVDAEALRRYAQVLRHARGLGLDVTVALVDAVWPSWLGLEAWLLPWVVPHVLAHARRVVETYGDDLTGVIAFARARELVTEGFLVGSAPPWRTSAHRDAGFANTQIEGLLEAMKNDPVVGPRLVRTCVVMNLDEVATSLAPVRDAPEVDEVHVRSLLRGSGPTSVATGLLAHHANEWRVSAPEELLSALR